MVNLVLVSHSRKLAEATAELARQMVPPQVKILVAAGIGDQREEFGTDAVEILEVVQEAYTSDGVLILMDLGSAVLSAEMARDMLDPKMQGKVVICPAPFVEGTISAGVQTGLGAGLDSVYQEAVQALMPKQEHIQPVEGMTSGQSSTVQAEQPETGHEQIVVTLINPHGLHARPASKFVQTASGFQANIQVKNLTTGKGPASAKSLNSIAALGVDHLHQIAITANGDQAAQALAELKTLVESGFGEVEPAEAQAAEQPPVHETAKSQIEDTDALTGTAISEGIANGLLSHFVKPKVEVVDAQVEDAPAEWNRLNVTVAEVQADIQKHRAILAKRLGEEFAAILDAHVMMLDDPEMVESARDLILNDHKNAEFAWQTSIQSVIQQFEALDNDYFKQRAVDVKGLGEQVLFKLAGVSTGLSFTSARSLVVLAEELSPSDTATLNFDQIAALVTLTGGKQSHSAILARALDIPLVSDVKSAILENPDGLLSLVDGSRGLVWVDPKPGTLNKIAL
jgi:phosphocarrier protein FPr